VLDSTATRHDMDSLALKYLGQKTIHFEDVAGKGAKQLSFNEVKVEEAGPYAAEDADITLRLHQTLWPRLQAQGKLTDVAAAVLAMTPEERSQVETAIERVKMDFRDWVLANVERIEPGDDVVAQYALPTNPVIGQTISNALVSAVSQALGQERAGLVLPSLQVWMRDIVGLYDSASAAVAFTIKRSITGDETQLKARVTTMRNDRSATDSYTIRDRSFAFPRAFRSIFPNAWADVAEREGFELPKKPEKK